MKFVITAGALTGNRGTEAMVTTCIQQIRQRYQEAQICIASYYPLDDVIEKNAKYGKDPHLYVYSSTPMALVLKWLPLSLLAWIFPFLKKKKCRDSGSFLEMLDADCVLDVAGVAFIDGREKFLPFNVLTLLPFLIHGVKAFKLSQAVGPISSFSNRICAHLILPRLDALFVRGRRTEGLVKESGLSVNFQYYPDVSFSMGSGVYQRYAERNKLAIGIIPSSLVMKNNAHYIDDVASIITRLQHEGYQPEIITHSWRDSGKARNNDTIAAKAINAQLVKQVPVHGVGMDSGKLREKISQYKVVLTSRFHGLIAALETQTPLLVIGWSHKYLEVLETFDLKDEYCIDYKSIDSDTIFERIQEVARDGAALSEKIAHHLEATKVQSGFQFEAVFVQLNSGRGESAR